MTDPAPSMPPPAEDPQGSLGAVLIGGAILVIAGLFIFWPDSESTTDARRTAASGATAEQGSNAVAGRDTKSGRAGGGAGRGVDPRDVDPAHPQAKKDPDARVTPGLHAPMGLSMAPPPVPTPEPTSFATTAEEIAYVEKKLAQARADLDARATFLERMQKIQQKSTSAEQDARNAGRAAIVKQNYENARVRVEELEKRLKSLREVKL